MATRQGSREKISGQWRKSKRAVNQKRQIKKSRKMLTYTQIEPMQRQTGKKRKNRGGKQETRTSERLSSKIIKNKKQTIKSTEEEGGMRGILVDLCM